MRRVIVAGKVKYLPIKNISNMILDKSIQNNLPDMDNNDINIPVYKKENKIIKSPLIVSEELNITKKIFQ